MFSIVEVVDVALVVEDVVFVVSVVTVEDDEVVVIVVLDCADVLSVETRSMLVESIGRVDVSKWIELTICTRCWRDNVITSNTLTSLCNICHCGCCL